MLLKLQDVYHARWRDSEKSNHCFEGLLIVSEEIDFVYLHSQHQCSDNCKRFYIKKGAVKSSIKMAASILNKIDKHKRDINYADSSIEWLEKDLAKVRAGDLQGINI